MDMSEKRKINHHNTYLPGCVGKVWRDKKCFLNKCFYVGGGGVCKEGGENKGLRCPGLDPEWYTELRH